MRKRILTAMLLLPVILQAQLKTNSFIEDAGASPRAHPLNFTKMVLDLSFEPKKGLVKGKATHYFTPLIPTVDSFFLDAIQMDIKEITLNDKTANFHADNVGITVYPATPLVWNQQYHMMIRYEVQPKKGLYFIGWNDKNNLSRKQIWSQGEMTDNRNWIPMYDEKNDKLLSELNVTFDKDYQVLSNGNLLDKQINADGTNTWHYAMSHPHAGYLIMLGIGKYDIKQTHSASGVPMQLYSYPEWKDRVNPVYQHSEEMVDFMEKETGVNFPWERYSQIPVQDYMFGAMENTTATIFGDFYLVDSRGVLDRNYIAVNAHELAHQWFGDYVTALTDADVWLQESFATYYNQMFERTVFGDDYFNWSRRGSQNAAIDESVKNKLGVANSLTGGVRLYGKGAFVLNMLKSLLGSRELYNKCIKNYLDIHGYQNVDTHDLLIAVEETSGMQLDWFWNEWLYRGGEPAYKVSFKEEGSAATMIVQQTQELTDVTGYKNGLYKMPFWVAIYYTDGTSVKKQYWIQEQTEILSLPVDAAKKIDYVLFDPNNEVLKAVVFDKPFEYLQAQALKAADMLDRFDAVAAMRSIPTERKRVVLLDAFNHEKFYAVKNEVIAQLATDTALSTRAMLKAALADKDVAVRKAALKNINPIVTGLLPAYEKLLTDSSYEVIENSLQKLVTVNPSKTTAYLTLTKNTEGNIGRNVKIKWLETAYQSTVKKQYTDQLVELSSSSYEFRTRINAMAALKRLNYYDETVAVNAVDALLSANNRLSSPAGDLLKFYYNQNRYKSQISLYISSTTWEPWQQAILDANGLITH